MYKCARLVKLEKYCQTHIFLQKFVLIQPRTSPPKICKLLPILLTLTPSSRELDGGGAAPGRLRRAVPKLSKFPKCLRYQEHLISAIFRFRCAVLNEIGNCGQNLVLQTYTLQIQYLDSYQPRRAAQYT